MLYYCPKCKGNHSKGQSCDAEPGDTSYYCPTCKKKHATNHVCHIRERHHSLYKTALWQRLRLITLEATPYCVMCDAPADTVDHIVPHRGDKELFYDDENLQSLCKSCHSIKTAHGL